MVGEGRVEQRLVEDPGVTVRLRPAHRQLAEHAHARGAVLQVAAHPGVVARERVLGSRVVAVAVYGGDPPGDRPERFPDQRGLARVEHDHDGLALGDPPTEERQDLIDEGAVVAVEEQVVMRRRAAHAATMTPGSVSQPRSPTSRRTGSEAPAIINGRGRPPRSARMPATSANSTSARSTRRSPWTLSSRKPSRPSTDSKSRSPASR